MNLRNEINSFVEKNNFFPGQIVDYSQYFARHENIEPILNGVHRRLQDFILITAWSTSKDGIQHVIYLPAAIKQISCAKIRFHDGMQTPSHTHNHVELIYVIEGTLSMQINGELNTFYANEICLINSETVHSEYLYAQNVTILCLGLDDIFFEQYEISSKSEDYAIHLKKLINRKRAEYLYMLFSPTSKDLTKTASAFELIMQELMEELPGKKRLLIGYVERIIDLLTKEYHIHIAQIDKKELHIAVINSICEYVRNTLPTVSVMDISEKFNYNPDYLNRLFKKEMKMNISNYIQECRIRHAYELLISTDFSIETISCMAGYHNIGFFYQKFKNKYGATPHHIRVRMTLPKIPYDAEIELS